MTWLVTGGAGYVGGHVVRALLGAGQQVVVLDDLSTGDATTVPAGVSVVRASVTQTAAVRRALTEHGITGVVHLAGRKSAAESTERPLLYRRQNVDGTRSLVEAMLDAGVRRIVLSSSAAVYGAPVVDAVTEQTPLRPVNPYGQSKLAAERIVRDTARASLVDFMILRYFNVAGVASPVPRERTAAGLVPQAIEAVARGTRPVVYGVDHPTPDGSPVRDFVHVADVAAAHAMAADLLERQVSCAAVYNVGGGVGHSVRDVLAVVARVTGAAFVEEPAPRRRGDPARVVACTERIRSELGWIARHCLEDMVRSEWAAWLARPRCRD